MSQHVLGTPPNQAHGAPVVSLVESSAHERRGVKRKVPEMAPFKQNTSQNHKTLTLEPKDHARAAHVSYA